MADAALPDNRPSRFAPWMRHACAPAAALLCLLSHAAADNVPDIRFGVIDPPVVAQFDITEPWHQTSNTSVEKKPIECASLAWAQGKLIILSDRHEHVLFVSDVDLAQMKIARPVPHVIIRNEQSLLKDGECLTIVRRGDEFSVYVMCSLSNDRSAEPLPLRRHMAKLTFASVSGLSSSHPVVLDASPLRLAVNTVFDKAGVRPYHTFFAEFAGEDKNTYRWGNVEGIAFTPDGKRMICGMRNPLLNGRAIMLAVGHVADAFEHVDAARMVLADAFTLDLGLRGVSDLTWDPATRGYLIAAARSNGPRRGDDRSFPPNSLDSALFWWSGRKNETPVLIARAPDMKIEAVCRLGDSRFIALGSDEGDESEGREQRQSRLTVMDFTGLKVRGGGAD